MKQVPTSWIEISNIRFRVVKEYRKEVQMAIKHGPIFILTNNQCM